MLLPVGEPRERLGRRNEIRLEVIGVSVCGYEEMNVIPSFPPFPCKYLEGVNKKMFTKNQIKLL